MKTEDKEKKASQAKDAKAAKASEEIKDAKAEQKAADATDIPQEPEEKAAEENDAAEKGAASKEAEESEKYARLFAEFSNYKRRTEKEKADLYAYAGEKFAVDLLEVMDNFERAMASRPEGAFADGMELILKQLRGVMDKNHVEEIAAEGAEFDPNLHNAVMTEDAEGVESGRVTKVFQKGYTLSGKVIRPAMVAVSN